ncbi:MAG: hypothetical protein V2B19_11335 [Pseudomonadota bacterium]
MFLSAREKDDMLRAVFDALPSLVFVVDQDVRIQEYNASASDQNRALVLLVIEDISEIAELRRIIPICSICRKVRDDTESWTRVEAYFKNNWDVDFSHGLCPDCYKIERDKLESYIETDKDADGTDKPGD